MKDAAEAAKKAEPIIEVVFEMAEERGFTLYEMMVIPTLIESRIKYSLRGEEAPYITRKPPKKTGENL